MLVRPSTIVFLASALLTAGLHAQSSTTLPTGFDTKPGTTNFWAGWDILNGSTTYYPARCVYVVDSTVFPWGSKAKVIRELQARRSSVSISTAGVTKAHSKTLRIWMSVNGNPAKALDTGNFDGNHGASKTLVLGTSTAPKKINFAADKLPAAGKVAPFNVRLVLDRPYIVPGKSTGIAIEIRTYASTSASGRWRPDATGGTHGAQGGSSVTLGTTTCLNPDITFAHLGVWPGNSLTHRYQTRRPGKLFIGLMGARLGKPIKLPGTTCELWNNLLILKAGISGTDALGTLDMSYGKVPYLARFVGLQLTHQLAFFDTKVNKLGIGLSRARQTTLGNAFTGTAKYGIVYSYGLSTSKWNNKLVDPDTETDPRYFTGRAIIYNVK